MLIASSVRINNEVNIPVDSKVLILIRRKISVQSISHGPVRKIDPTHECGYQSCLLLYVNTLYGMLAPLLNVNTFGMLTSPFQARSTG